MVEDKWKEYPHERDSRLMRDTAPYLVSAANLIVGEALPQPDGTYAITKEALEALQSALNLRKAALRAYEREKG